MQLNKYVLPQISNDTTIKSIFESQQIEVDSYQLNVRDLINQCFVDTATWGLAYWEGLLGIVTDENKTYERRREIIKSSLIGHGTVTIQLIKDTASAYSNGEVEVTENIEPFTFQVKFVGTKGIPPGLDELKKRLNLIKPAHLLVKYVIVYNTWGEVKTLTWANAQTGTWENLRVR